MTTPAGRFCGRRLLLTGTGAVANDECAVTDPPEGHVVLRVQACGICGTDIAEFRRRRAHLPAPESKRPASFVFGHEVSGVVVASASSGITVGTAVLVDPALACHECDACRREERCVQPHVLGGAGNSGGMAEYLGLPASAVLAVPEGLDAVTAALVEPLSCAYRATGKVPDASGAVVVLGGGYIGLAIARIMASTRGADVTVVERSPARRAVAAQMGLTACADPVAAPLAATVFETSGSTAMFEEAFRVVRRNGAIVVVSQHEAVVPIDLRVPFGKELRLLWTLGAAREDFAASLELLRKGSLQPLPPVAVVPLEHVTTGLLEDLAACVISKAVVRLDGA